MKPRPKEIMMSAIYAGARQLVNSNFTLAASSARAGQVTGCFGAIALVVKFRHAAGTVGGVITATATGRDDSSTSCAGGQAVTTDPTTVADAPNTANVTSTVIMYPTSGLPFLSGTLDIHAYAASGTHGVRIDVWPVFTDPQNPRGNTILQQLTLPA
jgi:hypothetical protein